MIDLPVIPVNQTQRKPDWLRVRLPVGKELNEQVSAIRILMLAERGSIPAAVSITYSLKCRFEKLD